MLISFLGTRGSIPSPSPDTVVYGGNTTSVKYVSDEGIFIIIDAGTGIRKLNDPESIRGLSDETPFYIFFTHSHWDHLQGLPFLFELYNQKRSFFFLINHIHYDTVKNNIIKQMSDKSFPVDFSLISKHINFVSVKDEYTFSDNLKLELFENNHPGKSSGVKFIDNNKVFTFITDNEIQLLKEEGRYQKMIDFCSNSDILAHEGQYLEKEMMSKRGYGHSTIEEVMGLFSSIRPKIGIFTHHDPGRSDEEVAEMEKYLKEKIAEQNIEMEIYGATENLTISY